MQKEYTFFKDLRGREFFILQYLITSISVYTSIYINYTILKTEEI